MLTGVRWIGRLARGGKRHGDVLPGERYDSIQSSSYVASVKLRPIPWVYHIPAQPPTQTIRQRWMVARICCYCLCWLCRKAHHVILPACASASLGMDSWPRYGCFFADDRGAPTLFAARHKGGHGLCRLHYFLA